MVHRDKAEHGTQRNKVQFIDQVLLVSVGTTHQSLEVKGEKEEFGEKEEVGEKKGFGEKEGFGKNKGLW